MERQKLTATQQKVYNIIVEFIKGNGYSPSVRELCILSNMSSTSTIHGYLERLEKKGYINRGPLGTSRAITLIEEETAQDKFNVFANIVLNVQYLGDKCLFRYEEGELKVADRETNEEIASINSPEQLIEFCSNAKIQ